MARVRPVAVYSVCVPEHIPQSSVGQEAPPAHLQLCRENESHQEIAEQRNITMFLIVKLREREGQGVDPGRSLKGNLWMVDGGWWYTFP